MDLSESLVDLLLVRLGREEEKQRVVDLLISELRMTREEARKAVDSSPTVLMEAVPMGQARVIQNRLYPFVDLLPRMETVKDDEPEEAQPSPARQAEPEFEKSGETVARPAQKSQPARTQAAQSRPAEAHDRMQIRNDELDDDTETPPVPDGRVSVTTASDEVLQIERCHVCGRTPTSGEKLAPCRSCAELTCRDCFDRVAHVCQKCAADGKVVDAPLTRTVRSRAGAMALETAMAGPPSAAPRPRTGSKLPLIIGAGIVVVALAAFLVLDPLHLMGGGTPDVIAPTDSSVVVPDSLAVTSPDTTPVPDTTLTVDFVDFEDLTLPGDAAAIVDAPPVPVETAGAPEGVEILASETGVLAPGLSQIAASIPVTIDRFAVLGVDGSTIVVAFSILHPEEDTVRYALLRKIGAWLEHSPAGELVFYYGESRYYPVRTVSFTRENFGRLSEAMGPMDFQECASSTSDEVWSLLTGPVQTWMARYGD